MVRSPTEFPAQRSPWARRRLIAATAMAIALPVLTAAALVPAREHLNQSAALIMILPVLLIASVGGAGPSIIAAVAAGVAFNFFLTQPYYSLDIHDDDDVIATVVLLVVAGSIGVVATRLAKLEARAATRLSMLRRVTAFAELTATTSEHDSLIQHAGDQIAELFGARGVVWSTELQATDAPILTSSGHILGRLSDLPADRAELPSGLVLPVSRNDVRIGCFVIDPASHYVVSLEERRTAVAITEMLGSAMTVHDTIDGSRERE